MNKQTYENRKNYTGNIYSIKVIKQFAIILKIKTLNI